MAISRRILLATAAAFSLAVSANVSLAADKLVIGYQTTVDLAKVPQAQGLYDKAVGLPIEWRKFDAGSDVIAAIASGDVQIGLVGSSPLTAAASSKVPFQTIFIAGLLGDAEALVVSDKSGIKEPKDLVGKKIAVPFVSTGHYSLLAALKHWNIDPRQVQILNLRPPEIIAAWERGDIDATYVWDPALGKAKASGKVLASSKQVGEWGAPTFDAWIARNDFIEKHPEAVRAFVRLTGEAHAAYRKDPAAWTASSGEVQDIARLTGGKAEDVPGILAGNELPTLEEQASADLLGGGLAKAIADTAAFLKEQNKIPAALPDYTPYITDRFVKEAAAGR
ncbi:MAG: taurine ABC transporter substrate-binding protein [Pseudochelatococcus sp.]|jgi:taurine transport system substrate-binding protein|uniref:taurine ABC transporter substrate-binding protein n=1 Tax=Pseudochelatococcus sp. TaxID=2020869 RepID=UPI003D8AB9C5